MATVLPDSDPSVAEVAEDYSVVSWEATLTTAGAVDSEARVHSECSEGEEAQVAP